MLTIPTLEDLNLGVTVPALSIATWACLLLLIDLWVPKAHKERTAWLAAGGVVFAFVVTLFTFQTTGDAFMGLFRADEFTAFINLAVLLTAFISILLSIDYLKRAGIERGEYYVLLLFTTSGAMFMASANDLITVFVALELLSIPLYILSAFRAPEPKSEESGMKYFILGAFASAFFAYGAALVYGATGSTNIPEIFATVERVVAESSTAIFLLLLGAGLMLVGLGFKVAVVPFHTWTPDVYEGAPTPVTAFMSVAAKIGGFAALLRIMAVGLPEFVLVEGQINAAWQQTVALVAAATLILANLVAIWQNNIKRLLAYSSIAHAGYIMMAVAAAGTLGVADLAVRGALFYLIAYAVSNLGAFAIAMQVERNDATGTDLNNFVGLGKTQPLLAFMMAVFMLSLTGIPLTSGFIGKWFVFGATIEAGLVGLAVVGVLTSVVSAYYYIRVIVNMYLRDPDAETPASDLPGATPLLNWGVYAA
ncbi:MAG: NADH-quinone oxidoreductase subunit N, partial [Chloroflexi bacterium]|nr:NADH-quinone oxidoreductase subunit N [Chloroflexota bacterium]